MMSTCQGHFFLNITVGDNLLDVTYHSHFFHNTDECEIKYETEVGPLHVLLAQPELS